MSPSGARGGASKRLLGVALTGSKSFSRIRCMSLKQALASGLVMLHTEVSLGAGEGARLNFLLLILMHPLSRTAKVGVGWGFDRMYYS